MRRPLLALSLALSTVSVAQTAPASPARAEPGRSALRVEIPFEKYTLPNGLEVILHEDHQLPVVAVDVWYHVGAFHEQPGRSGFAHLFEHMMFQGSAHVGDDMHIRLLEELGGTDLNGTTNFDRTNYFETVPSHHLETALWLESDRMGFLLPTVDEAKLDNQREVVKNERRQRIETQPYGIASEKLWKALFPKPHPYNGRVIGSMEDLSAATLQDVHDFFRTWYAPSNATLSIAGDFDKAEAKKLIEKYFGSLPKSPDPENPDVKPVRIERETVIHHDEELGTVPVVMMAWHSAPFYAEGDADADIAAEILSSGKSSRLYSKLVHEKRIAQQVNVANQSLGAQSAFLITIVGAPGVKTEQLLEETDAVLEELRQKGVQAAEVQRPVNRILTGRVSSLQSVGGFGGKADLLQQYNHFVGDPGFIDEDLARYEVVTPESVQAYVKNTLDPNHRVVLHATPVEREQPQAATSAQKEKN